MKTKYFYSISSFVEWRGKNNYNITSMAVFEGNLIVNYNVNK